MHQKPWQSRLPVFCFASSDNADLTSIVPGRDVSSKPELSPLRRPIWTPTVFPRVGIFSARLVTADPAIEAIERDIRLRHSWNWLNLKIAAVAVTQLRRPRVMPHRAMEGW